MSHLVSKYKRGYAMSKDIKPYQLRYGAEKVKLNKSQQTALELTRQFFAIKHELDEITGVKNIKKVRVIRGGHVIDRFLAK